MVVVTSENGRYLRLRLKHRDRLADGVGVQQDIGIGKHQDVARSQRRAPVSRQARPALFFHGDQLYPVPPGDLGRARFGRGVVHHDALGQGVIRFQNGRQAAVEVIAGVPGRNDHRYGQLVFFINH